MPLARALGPYFAACLDGESGAMGVAAMPDRLGGAVVRVQRANGTQIDCDVVSGPPVRARDRLPVPPDGRRHVADSDPVFLRERGCPDAVRVDGGDGRVLGWLAYPACR